MKATMMRDGFELMPENDADRTDLNEFRKKLKEPHVIWVSAYMWSCTTFLVAPETGGENEPNSKNRS